MREVRSEYSFIQLLYKRCIRRGCVDEGVTYEDQ